MSSNYDHVLPTIFPFNMVVPRIYLQDLIDRFNDTDEYTRVDGMPERTANGSSFAVTADASPGYAKLWMSSTSYQKWLIYNDERIRKERKREEREQEHRKHMDKIFEEWGHLLP
jgi:hypothetical protein